MRLFNDEEAVIDSTNKNRAQQCSDAKPELPESETLVDPEMYDDEPEMEVQVVKEEGDKDL